MTTAVSDEEIDELVKWLRRFDRVKGKSEQAASALVALKCERDAFADTLVLTEDHYKAELKKQAAKAEAEFNAMTVEMRAVNIARVIEATGVDIIDLADRCERAEQERDDLREALKIYQKEPNRLMSSWLHHARVHNTLHASFRTFVMSRVPEPGKASERIITRLREADLPPHAVDWRVISTWLSQHGFDDAEIEQAFRIHERYTSKGAKAYKTFRDSNRRSQDELFGSTPDRGPQRLDGEAPGHDN
jgi:hypothetical protein